MIDEIHFTKLDKPKLSLLKKLKLDIWIDDSPSEVLRTAKAGIRTYMVTNEGTCYNWKLRDIPSIIPIESVSDIKLI